ncbi:O-methyltransferase [Sporosarcina sp. ACRSM]|uniref:O-methyltransferase n=1 Tax=Sporosarcina sp. ACRSM TaxID=2918216 RepID=UPI001EF588AE|nr:O-methyltransferase [Sporosarcina sp. ACRSM]MCG7336454.1 O-methyltransferase [Sporosarcina sp. ACRSM]
MGNYEAYLAGFRQEQNALIIEMEQYAAEHHVPIMDRAGIDLLISLLRIHKPARILEIGSAIGYSAIRIAEALPDSSIVTIERDRDRYLKAVDYIQRSGRKEQITIIETDALQTEEPDIFTRSYDALFIDAAKGQYQAFFQKYAPTVTSSGVIYCDNMFMHGMVLLEDEEVPRRKRTMIRNLKEFTRWIMAHPDYEASLLPVGDGLLIAVKK